MGLWGIVKTTARALFGSGNPGTATLQAKNQTIKERVTHCLVSAEAAFKRRKYDLVNAQLALIKIEAIPRMNKINQPDVWQMIESNANGGTVAVTIYQSKKIDEDRLRERLTATFKHLKNEIEKLR